MLHGADRGGHIGHQIDLVGSAHEVLVDGLANAIRVADQHVDRAIQAVDASLCRDKAFLQVAFALRL